MLESRKHNVRVKVWTYKIHFSISLHTHNLLPPAFSALWNKFADFFFFYNDSQKEEWACGVSAGCLKGSWLYSNCSPCGSEWLPYMCEAVYHKCDMCKDEYMPSKTDQNDEHFWASSSLMVPPSVMSCCRSLLFFLLLFSWGPDHNECNQSSGVIFVQSYYCRCYTEEYSGACVCAFSFLTFDTSPRSISQCFAMSLCGPAGQRKCQSAQCYSG